MKISTIAIIGCGGVTSHILPALINQFDLLLVDGDKYEPGNVSRQLAAHVGDGKNKAEVLASIYQPYTKKKIAVLPQYLDDNTEVPSVDLFLVAVDNHDARLSSVEQAKRQYSPLIWGANEEYDPQAFMYLPKWDGTNRDPIVRMGIKKDGRSPLASCNSQTSLEEKPQLAIANNVAGAFMLSMVHALQNISNELNLPAEIIGATNNITVTKFRNIPEVAETAGSAQAEAARSLVREGV